MAELLNEQQIDLLEKYILENNSYYAPSISPKDTNTQNYYYNLIKDAPCKTYYIFGNSGFTSYAYYRAKNNKIYIISSYLNEICSYYLEN